MTRIPVRPGPAKFSPSEALFTRLYLEHRDFLRRLLLGQNIPPRDVDDLVQDTFVVAWLRLASLVAPGQARSWLCVIGFHLAANHRKRARFEREILTDLGDHLPELADEAASPHEILHSMYAMLRLRRFIERIGPKLREVFVPFAIEGKSPEEIAVALGIKRETVYGRLKLAREQIQRLAPA